MKVNVSLMDEKFCDLEDPAKMVPLPLTLFNTMVRATTSNIVRTL